MDSEMIGKDMLKALNRDMDLVKEADQAHGHPGVRYRISNQVSAIVRSEFGDQVVDACKLFFRGLNGQ